MRAAVFNMSRSISGGAKVRARSEYSDRICIVHLVPIWATSTALPRFVYSRARARKCPLMTSMSTRVGAGRELRDRQEFLDRQVRLRGEAFHEDLAERVVLLPEFHLLQMREEEQGHEHGDLVPHAARG